MMNNNDEAPKSTKLEQTNECPTTQLSPKKLNFLYTEKTRSCQ